MGALTGAVRPLVTSLGHDVLWFTHVLFAMRVRVCCLSCYSCLSCETYCQAVMVRAMVMFGVSFFVVVFIIVS